VISESPIAGTLVASGSAVSLTVSSGNQVAVPDVVGQTQTGAAVRPPVRQNTPLIVRHLMVQKNTAVWTQDEHRSAIGKWAGLIEFLFWISVVAASVGFLLTNAVTHP